MKLYGVPVLALLAFAGTAVATPRESTTFPASINSASNGATGGGHTQADGTVTLNQTFTGGYNAVRINMTGTLNSVNAGTYASEARIYVTPSGGNAPFTINPFAQATYTSLPIPAGYGVNLGAGYNPVGQWSYIFFETYQDGAGGSTNSTWDNLVLTFDDAVPPPPPPPTASIDFGVLAPSPDFLPAQSVDITDPAQVGWVKFIVPQAITSTNGRYLDIDTQGSTMADTYMVWFDSTGTPIPGLINDDGGVGLMSLMSFGSGIRPGPGGDALNYGGQNGNLVAGTYWVAVCDYFPTGIAAPYQITPGGDLGSITVNLRYNEMPPPAPPTVFFNMGTIPTTGTFVTHTFGLDPATVKWAKITLASPIAAASSTFLDLDTETSTVLATAICLFNPDGTIAGQDTVDGSGNLSQLTFGAGTRLAEGDGALYSGRDGANLAAGDYFVAVSLTPAAFAAGWQATSTSADTGDLVLRVRAGTQPPPTPPAVFTNLGTLAAGLRSESNALTGTDIKWFKFIINADVSVANNTFLDIDTENSAVTAGTVYDTFMTLFDNLGAIRAQDDDDGSGFHSQFSFGQTTPPRPAVSTNGGAAGLAYNGRDGDLVAGTYWLAAYGYPNAAGSPTAGFIVASTSAQDGTLVVNFNLGTPVPPAPPSSFTNLGALASNGNFVTNTTNVTTPRQVAWYKFTLSTAVDRLTSTYIDMDTEGSTVPATAMALFGAATGNLIVQDTVDGTGTLSMISIGKGTRAAPGDGLPYDGRDGATLAAGDYYVAVTSAFAAFANGWQAASSNTDTGGTLVFNIRTGTAPPTPPPSPVYDVGNLHGDKTVDTENGNPINFDAGTVRWFRFVTPQEASTASGKYLDIDTEGTSLTADAFGVNDSEIGLYSSGGAFIATDDDDGSGWGSLLTFGDTANVRPTVGDGTARDGRDGVLPAGTYYLAFGGFNTDFSATVDFGVTTTSAVSGTIVINLLNNFVNAGPVPCNAADVAGLGGSVGADHALTADDVIVYLGAFFSGNTAIADIAVLGGAPGHDGQLTADDIILFLSQFFLPCL